MSIIIPGLDFDTKYYIKTYASDNATSNINQCDNADTNSSITTLVGSLIGQSFPIKFTGSQSMSNTFKNQCELLDANGNVQSGGDINTTHYRFKTEWTDAYYMFQYRHALQSIALPDSWGWGNVTNTVGMFYYCRALQSITLPSDWGNVTSTNGMFFQTSKLTSKAPGILVSPGYYRSSSNGTFPTECYRDGLSLNF